jgi:hypothetical protein
MDYGDGRVVLERIDDAKGYVPGNVRFVRTDADDRLRRERFRRRHPGLV